ncbi:LGFP repeat-containing protein, partial [Streptomyces sp. AC495_CC817]|uniref:LGFP repeat-containing protein n=1 Tax=Streptomyces sp. AC495_CC817 TaxID=2823900 RepID=UPI001C27752B
MSRRAPRSRNTRRIPQILATFAAAAAMVIGVLVPTTAAVAAPAGPVPARDVKATLVGFTPGNIISDAVFTNRDSMTEAQIQSFFNSKVPRCLGGSDQYGPRVCLKDYKITSVNRPADKYCNGYTGAANETAARIIYRVSQSCGINPQVLIVMLQKEQSLVTSTSPTAPRYWSALGQGCPDSGVSCDPAYVGFFHQIYGAARQMQIYMEGRYFTYYAPGKTWNIYWHPPKLVNGKWVYTCGSGPVYVENKATSALYYYTPYQPNAAAIRAGYGEGDDCSAYGNRNFYNYFTDWFGSTQASGPGEGSLAISKAWAEAGGKTGSWGNRLDAPACSGSVACGHVFEKVIAYWQPGQGILLATGTIAQWARSQGVANVGYPNSAPVTVSENGGGVAQSFTKVLVNAGPSGVFAVSGLTRDEHAELGGVRQATGWPISAKTCATGGDNCVQSFQNAVISEVGGHAWSVADGDVLKKYRATGGPQGQLGIPTSTLVSSSASGGGQEQAFTSGAIAKTSSGTFSMIGAFRVAHSRAGGVSGQLGWVTGDAVCGQPGGGCSQSYQKGAVHSATSGGSPYFVSGPIATFYQSNGGPGGSLGYPVSDTIPVSANGGGVAQAFAGGLVNAGPAGAFLMTG